MLWVSATFWSSGIMAYFSIRVILVELGALLERKELLFSEHFLIRYFIFIDFGIKFIFSLLNNLLLFFFSFSFFFFFFLLSKTFEGWLKLRFWYLIINLWRLDSLVEIYLDISSITKGKVCLFTNLFGTSYLKHFITPPSCLFLSRKYGCLNP